jgi:hypothetical protein
MNMLSLPKLLEIKAGWKVPMPSVIAGMTVNMQPQVLCYVTSVH